MKHTEEYLQSKEVLKYPSKYHDRDVERAMIFVNGYEQALSIGAVGQSFYCPDCKSKAMHNDAYSYYYCPNGCNVSIGQ